MSVTYESHLCHHGVKGMKWGVRRYQDSNGRYTSAGRKRYIADRVKGVDKDIKRYDESIKGLEIARGKVASKYGESRARGIDKDIQRFKEGRQGLEYARTAISDKYGKKYDKKMQKQQGWKPSPMTISDADSSVTKRAKQDFNTMTDQEFMNKYSTSKKTYASRVEKYGDPYMNSPMAKLGKKLQGSNLAKKSVNSILREADARDKVKNGKDYLDMMK